MADRVAVLHEGKIQQIDTAEEIYNQPANLFVAQFVGSPRINLLPCVFDSDKSQICDEGGLWRIPLSLDQRAKLADVSHSQLRFGIRSEDVNLAAANTDGALNGKIFTIEPLGDRIYVDISLGKNVVRARASASFEGREGDNIWFHFDVKRFHIFDKHTGNTIF
jgi:ABC-type sugar transport system ATPase subunit